MKVVQKIFGQIPGKGDASLYTITNSNGITLKITDYGGTIQSIMVPDKNGKPGDVRGSDTMSAVNSRVTSSFTRASNPWMGDV